MARAVQRITARRDFINHYVYLAEKPVSKLRIAFGSPLNPLTRILPKCPDWVRQGKHAGVRLWRVRDFEEYLIAYRPHRRVLPSNALFTRSKTISEY